MDLTNKRQQETGKHGGRWQVRGRWKRGMASGLLEMDRIGDTVAVCACMLTNKTSQELRMLSSVTINCQITKIVMNSGSQLSEL